MTRTFWRQPRFWITLVAVWIAIAVALRLLERVVDPDTVWHSEQWIVHLAMYLLALAGAWAVARLVASKQSMTDRGFDVVPRDSGGPGAA